MESYKKALIYFFKRFKKEEFNCKNRSFKYF